MELQEGRIYPPLGTPQDGAYPSQGGAYTPSFNPPPYYPQATPQQQMGSTIIVVHRQPTVATTVITRVGDYYFITSIVLSFICFFCFSWWSLCCTIPAIFAAISARDAAARGDLEGARRSGQMALGLNIVAVVFFIIIWAVIIGLAAGVQSTTRCYYSYSGYYTCY
eukprot:Em0003g1782a